MRFQDFQDYSGENVKKIPCRAKGTLKVITILGTFTKKNC